MLINMQAVIDVLAEMQGQCTTKAALTQNSKIWKQIKKLPSVDAVPVVRCKDCKYFSAVDNRFYKTQECYRIMIPDGDEDFPIDTTEDGFCSWGERKEDAH